MSELKAIIKTVKKTYPKDEELWVEFYTDVPMGIAEDLTDDNVKLAFKMIVNMVADWNFADRNGEKLEISVENAKRLPAQIATWIVNEANDLLIGVEDKKK